MDSFILFRYLLLLFIIHKKKCTGKVSNHANAEKKSKLLYFNQITRDLEKKNNLDTTGYWKNRALAINASTQALLAGPDTGRAAMIIKKRILIRMFFHVLSKGSEVVNNSKQ